MRVKIFYGPPIKLERDLKKFLKDVQLLDIFQIDTVGLPSGVEGVPDHIAVLIWLKGS